MIKYSPQAARAIGYLKQANNDIEIFVEDKANPNMWLAIIRAVLPPTTKIRSVTALGGRSNVLAACELDQNPSPRRRLYIIDGDFDYSLRRQKPKLKHLYRLRAYCIENLVLSKESVAKLARLLQPTWDDPKINKQLAFNTWYDPAIIMLRTLFICYAASHSLTPARPTISLRMHPLLRNTPGGQVLCGKKTLQRCASVSRGVCHDTGVSTYLAAMTEIRATVGSLPDQFAFSAKDYLLPLVAMRLRKILSFAGNHDQLLCLLAREWQSSLEPYFARRLRSL